MIDQMNTKGLSGMKPSEGIFWFHVPCDRY